MSRELWQAVLLRTVADAVLGVSQESNRDTRIRICEEARRYLTSPSRDLSEVCALADMDMNAVIEKMRNQIAQAPTPKELADNPGRSIATFTKAAAKPKQKRIPFPDRQFTFDGITRTAADWCARTGIALQTAQWRINQSWAPERAFTLTAEDARAEHRASARRSFNMNSAEISARIKEGLRRSAAMNGAPHKRGTEPTLYQYDGEARSLAEWSEITGIGKNTIYKRITVQGMTFAQAIETPVGKGQKTA
ncbi:hypothetical protein GIY56_00630 [Paracoccus sp. YIM 132242]|uniref:Uncharacterized protein n=1 Tax=Paracoccus lichenicola TaxID=2665644 RepID=A0A6L6HJQ6_9RHOB|nr:hypothetical protein [Paracoccus lichenicola]MTD98788.1 hypothetical protein [Paracoccus lichenicola]